MIQTGSREAELVAALNHSHIAHVHGIPELDENSSPASITTSRLTGSASS
jgi:hypothetical protein